MTGHDILDEYPCISACRSLSAVSPTSPANRCSVSSSMGNICRLLLVCPCKWSHNVTLRPGLQARKGRKMNFRPLDVEDEEERKRKERAAAKLQEIEERIARRQAEEQCAPPSCPLPLQASMPKSDLCHYMCPSIPLRLTFCMSVHVALHWLRGQG